MLSIANQTSLTLFADRAGADKLAARNAAIDPDWSYRVVENAAGQFYVEVRDEAGERVGTL